MQRKSYIIQHPHQDMRKGRAAYASATRVNSSTNRSMDFQSFTNGLAHHADTMVINHTLLDDEDSDEQTLYYAKDKKKNK